MIGTPKPIRQYADRAEAVAVLNGLSRLDWLRIDRIADLLALKLAGWEGGDLRNVAIVKMLSGERPWPRDAAVTPFLVMVMKGVISNERKKARDWSPLDDNLADEEALSPAQVLEQEEAERVLRANVREALARHPNAQAVAIGMLDGLRGEPLRSYVGLDAVSFASARRTVKRDLFRRRRRP